MNDLCDAPIPASIPLDDLADVQSYDAQIKEVHAHLGQLEHQQLLLDDAKAQARAQLGTIIREQTIANKRLAKRYNLPDGTAVDLANGAVILPR